MESTPHNGPVRVMMRLKVLQNCTGLSKSTIYDKVNPDSPRYDPTFPKQVLISAGVVAWVATEVDAWIASRIEAGRT
jgi:prophage regulatory protein